MNPARLADYHRRLAALHAALADELASEASPDVTANDVRPPAPSRPKKKQRRGGPRVVSAEKLALLGVSDTDVAAAGKVAGRRGMLRNGG